MIKLMSTKHLTTSMKRCRKCRDTLALEQFGLDRLGKYGRASTCLACKKKKDQKKSNELRKKALLGKVQVTIPAEKRKAFVRDGKCIIPDCVVADYSLLDFHHVYWHGSERIYEEERNKHWNGVMLCRPHHTKVQTDKALDLYCHMYLAKKAHE